MHSLPTKHAGIGNSIASLMRNLGRISGVAFAAMLFVTTQQHFLALHANATDAFFAGFKSALLLAAAVTTGGLCLALLRTRFEQIGTSLSSLANANIENLSEGHDYLQKRRLDRI